MNAAIHPRFAERRARVEYEHQVAQHSRDLDELVKPRLQTLEPAPWGIWAVITGLSIFAAVLYLTVRYIDGR